MKYIILFFVLANFSSLMGQEKGINLIKEIDTTFLVEGRRIKVSMLDGKKIIGNFTIVSNSEIKIKNKTILLDSIVKIRKASMFSAIASPIALTAGTILLGSGVVGAVAGGYGLLVTIVAVPAGLPLFILPLTPRKHSKDKWSYEIVN